MSGQIITLRGTQNDCWIVSRFVSDDPHWFGPSFEEEWFAMLAEHWIVAYSEFSHCEVSPCPKVQCVLRRAPVVC